MDAQLLLTAMDVGAAQPQALAAGAGDAEAMDAETAALFQGAAVAGRTPSPAGGDPDINDIIDSPPDIIGGLDLEALGVTVQAEAAARPQRDAARRRRRRWGPGGGGTGGGTGGAATAEAEAAALLQEGTAMTGDKPPSPAGGGPPSRRRPSCSPARGAVAEVSEAPAGAEEFFAKAPAGSHGERSAEPWPAVSGALAGAGEPVGGGSPASGAGPAGGEVPAEDTRRLRVSGKKGHSMTAPLQYSISPLRT